MLRKSMKQLNKEFKRKKKREEKARKHLNNFRKGLK